MGYLGYKPADKPLTSADITDGIVSIADLSATGTPSSSNFLRGDGTWNAPQAGFSGATENAVSSSPLTLTNTSTQYHKVQISSTTNNYVTLPNATTMATEGTPVFVIENASAITLGLDIKNNGGTTIGTLPANYTGFITLVDNSTTNGTWQINITADQAIIEVSSTVNSNTPTNTSAVKVIHLTSTKLLVANFYQSSTGTYTMYTKIGDLSGGTITFGSQQSTTITVPNSYGVSFAKQDIVRLSDSAFILFWGVTADDSASQYYTNKKISVNTVSGTTITFGSQNGLSFPINNVGTANQGYGNVSNGMCCRMADDKFAVVYNTATTNATSNNYLSAYSGSLTCNIITVSGTTLTVGTKVDLGSSTYTQPTTLVCHDTDKLCVVYYQHTSATNTTGRTKVNIISVSSTTPTWGTSVNVESSDILNVNDNIFQWGYTSLNNMYGVALSTTSVIGIGGGTGSNITGFILISISGTTPTITSTKNFGLTTPPLLINSTTIYTQGYYIYISSGLLRLSPVISYTANSPTYMAGVITRNTTASVNVTFYSGGNPNYIAIGTLLP